ncbi:A alpha-helical domain with a conserved ER moti [Aureimonas altamirensis]|uniref:A alpha-helical domain with a conserved ER moti n=1 Tax=Aureimonas altamirensis TaxID=370622 RepID=A0A0B1Q0C1_9HYPH|nr:alpha-E domain-containing protein [Aureimonas altamirensis]KHJ54203.1 A alpha-helical domain with a conserved ER moti [Aureimonas altamirensis]
MPLLGRTANGLFWMQRYIERAENTARLIDAGLRLSLTNLSADADEWNSVLVTAGVLDAYQARHDVLDPDLIAEFMLRDPANPSSILNSLAAARTNGRMVRTALTRETWEALNESWMLLRDRLSRPITDLPALLELIKQRCALIRGSFYGTMLRNEIFDFCNIGTFLERADNTARILDVKYWVLLPQHSYVGSSLDNYQWGSILRSVSALRSYAWEYDAELKAVDIVDFLILNRRMPRSLAYCYRLIEESLSYLSRTYGEAHECDEIARSIARRLEETTVGDIIDAGLHEFLEWFILENNRLSDEIARTYRFHS